MNKPIRMPARPAITVTSRDHAVLSRMVDAAAVNLPELSAELGHELDRARILPEGRVSTDHVHIGSEVAFRDDATGKTSIVTLVLPEDADIAQGRVSVMTPVGIALIGMAAGKSIDWTTRGGERRRMTVVSVGDPAEAA